MAGIEAGFINVLIAPKLVSDFSKTIGSDLDKKLLPLADKTGKAFGERLSKGLTTAGKGLTAGVTAPIIAGFTAALGVAKELDGVYDNLRVQTGATGAVLDGLKEDFRAVARESAQSFEDIGATIATLNQNLGITGKPLQDLALQITNIKQVTGELADTKGITQFFNAFSIGADKQSETLDKLFIVSQKTGVSFNELVANTQANAAAFQTLGFGAVEAAAFVGQLEKNGANAGAVLSGLNRSIAASLSGDKSATAARENLAKAQETYREKILDLRVAEQKLREVQSDFRAKPSAILSAQNAVGKLVNEINKAGAEIDKNNKIISSATQSVGKTTENYFASVVAEIQKLIQAGDEAGAQVVAKDIFGARAFNTVLKQIKEGTFNLEGFTSEVLNSTESINNLAAETADFPEQLQNVKNQAKLALEPIGNVLFPAIADAIKAATPAIEAFSRAFGSLSPEQAKIVVGLAGIVAAVGPVLLILAKLVTAINTIRSAQLLLNLAFLANPAVLIAGAIVVALVLIVKNIDKVKAAFNAVGKAITTILKAIGKLISSPILAVFKGIQSVGKFAKIPGFADGGRFEANKPMIVGERGPELLMPRSAGSILPNNALAGMLQNRSGAVYNVVINNPVAERSAQSIPAALRRANILRGGV